VELAFFVSLFVYASIVLGLVARLAWKRGFINDGPVFYVVKKVKYSLPDERLIYLLSVILFFSVPLSVYLVLINPESAVAQMLVVSMVSLALMVTVYYVLTSSEIKGACKRYSSYLAFLVTVSITVNLSRATSFAESVINELLGIRASELPTGLAWLSIIMTPVAWIITLAIGFLAAYIAVLFNTGRKDVRNNLSLVGSGLAPIRNSTSRELRAGYAIAISFAVLAVSPISLISGFLSTAWAEMKIREQLVGASFHIDARRCGIDDIKGAKIAFLEFGKAIIAMPDEKLGYTFKRLQCDVYWETPEEVYESYASERKMVDADGR
jgi:hypothetical protein